jgi:glutathione peroxidase
MKNFVFVFFLVSQLLSAAPLTKKEPSCPPLLNQTVRTIDGQMTNLCGFAGKTILVVNVASECGFTPQYKDLEALYKKYQTQNFVVLGFPSNDFMGQEPGSSAEIKAFAQKNFQISFPLFEKGAVTGNNI